MTATIFFGLLAALAATPQVPSDRAPRPRIVALGDSLTSGHGIGQARAFPAVLQQKLDAAGFNFEVVNAGISGATTADGVRRVERALTGDVRVLLVALGANDGLRGVPVADVRSNLERIIAKAQARDIQVLLCGMDALPLYGWDYTVAFHKTFPELAARYNVPLVPFMLRGVIGDEAMMQRDHIHPNPEGARQIAENVWPYLTPLLENVPALTR
jgi:acyl-CoA thioesterase-1